RLPFLAPLKNIFYGLDILLNLPVQARLSFWKQHKKLPPDVRINPIEKIDKTTAQFIQKLSANDLIQRNAATFNWIIQYPWLNTSKAFTGRYYFSAYAKQFQNSLLQVFRNDQLVAFLWLTYRDGTAKLPYCYVLPGNEEIAVRVLCRQLIRLRADTFICFQKNIFEALRKSPPPFLFQKTKTKVFGWSKTLERYFEHQPYIQDGDGDGMFT
ncbi:MAG: hypothetical protein ACI81W_004210, partial [Saprospiraceae bacterium]